MADEIYHGGRSNGKTLNSISKFIAIVLRHKPEEADCVMSPEGWIDVKQLIKGIKARYPHYNFAMEALQYIVDNDDKGRYQFDEHKQRIRACQGHSVAVDLGLKEQQPPQLLFHGTSTKYLDSIMKEGIIAKSRLYVHLSKDVDTANKVGQRHSGVTVILIVSAEQMYNDGHKFYLSDNGVWLVDKVPPQYFTLRHIQNEFDLKQLKVTVGEYDDHFEYHIVH